jgi:glyoxylase-like metal-dependent hydrolase (beta-lactamase superfamily II)
VVETFEDQATFCLGRFPIQALLLPGHTPGSVGCVRPALLSGYALRAKRGRTDLPGGDAAAIDKSIEALIDSTDGLSAIFPGHGHPWSAAKHAPGGHARRRDQEHEGAHRRVESALPDTCITNADLSREHPDWDMDEVAKRTGVRERRICAPGETATDLAQRACERLLDRLAFLDPGGRR